jgi:hypothetical protein
MTTIVFNDTKNTDFDEQYAEELKQSFRNLTGWKVEKDTRIDKELDKFSLGYSKEKRNTQEVAVIFKLAYKIGD